MIGEVNQALEALLTPLLPAGCTVRFGPPSPPSPTASRIPACDAPDREGTAEAGDAQNGLNLFLVDVREDEKAGGTDWEDLRDEAGRVVARRPPTRRFDLHYVVTVDATDLGQQARLLDAVLIAADPGRRLDPELLGVDLAGKPVRLRPSTDAAAAYSRLDLPPRTVLGLVVNAPLVLPAVTEIAAPPEQISLGVAGQPRDPRPAPERAPAPTLRRARIEE